MDQREDYLGKLSPFGLALKTIPRGLIDAKISGPYR